MGMANATYALSVKQPWAWLICKGYKDIENRNWKIGRKPVPGMSYAKFTISLPERVYVHAGKEIDTDGFAYIPDEVLAEMPEDLFTGGIIGEVDITDCVTESKSLWFVGKYGFTLANPVLYDRPILCRGSLGFFKPMIGVQSGR